MKHRELVNRSAAESNLAYQAKYRAQPKECDKVLLSLLEGLSGKLLDIGCSNGNLLRHIKSRYSFDLYGGDISELRINACRKDPDLAGITFAVMDAMDLPANSYDVIVANAVLCMLNKDEYTKAVHSIHKALKPGGRLITLDWLHPANQDLAIIEESDEIPEGVRLYFRSYRWTRETLTKAGFHHIDFLPFELPIDLPLDHSQAITTHTVKMSDGDRLQFRGALMQPWCHMVTRRGY